MADNVTVDNGDGTDYTVSADEGSGGQVQRVKLAYSADGSETHVPADADGLLVNLGSNNDVTVTGTVTATDGGSTISVDDGGSTITVDGTVTADAGTGPWPVTDNGGSLTVDGTVAISGTVAVTDNASTLSVDDGGSSISIDDGGNTITVDGTVTVTDGSGSLTVDGSVTADTELTTADLDTGGGTDTRAVVGIVLAANGGGVLAGAANPVPISDNSSTISVDDAGSSLTVDGTVAATQSGTWTLGANSGTDIGDVTINNGSGGSAVNIQDGGNTITVDGTVTVQDGGGAITVDNAGTFSVQVSSIAAGNNNIGDVDVASLPALAAGTNTIGAVNVKPTTSGGLTIFRSIDLDESEEEVKGSAGQLYGWFLYNDGAAEVYVKVYNATAANVTVGTTTPVLTIPVPAGSAANVEFTNGLAFSTAITAAATTAVADNDTGAPAANQVIANLFYA